VDEMARLKDYLPDFSTVFRLAFSEPGQKRDLHLEPEEWNALALVDSRRDINGIVAASSLESILTLKHLATLQLAGLIRPSDKSVSDGPGLEAMVDRLGRLIEDYLVTRPVGAASESDKNRD